MAKHNHFSGDPGNAGLCVCCPRMMGKWVWGPWAPAFCCSSCPLPPQRPSGLTVSEDNLLQSQGRENQREQSCKTLKVRPGKCLNPPFLKMKSLTVNESSEQGRFRVAPAEVVWLVPLREAPVPTGVCGMRVLHSSLKGLNECFSSMGSHRVGHD